MKYFIILGSVLLVPLLSFAAGLQGVLDTIAMLISSAIPLVIGLALLAFFWGLAKYIWSSGEGKDDGKQMMISGVIALFVMVSVWGLVRLLGETFGIQSGTSLQQVPGVPLQTLDYNL